MEIIEGRQMELSDYIEIKQEIRRNLNSIVVSFVQVGYYLRKVSMSEMYLADGYDSVWAFAAGEYNLDRTAASKMMSINEKFSEGGYSRALAKRYQGLNKSILTEMLTLPENDYDLITPDTRVSDIRDLKKAEREMHPLDEQLEGQTNITDFIPTQESETPEDDELERMLIREMFRPMNMKSILNRLIISSPGKPEFRYLIEELNPSGNRVEKKIPLFLFFYKFEDGLKWKNVIKQTTTPITYEDFYFRVRRVFGTECVTNPTNVWEAAFGNDKNRAECKEPEQSASQTEQREDTSPASTEEKDTSPQKAEFASKQQSVKNEPPKAEKTENGAKLGREDYKENSTGHNTEEQENETNPEIQTLTGEVQGTVCDIAQYETDGLRTPLDAAKEWITQGERVTHRCNIETEEYNRIVQGTQRFYMSKDKMATGDIIQIPAEQGKTLTTIILSCVRVPFTGWTIYGIEVLGYGEKE